MIFNKNPIPNHDFKKEEGNSNQSGVSSCGYIVDSLARHFYLGYK